MPVIKHEHQLNSAERAFFEAVCADPGAATNSRPAIRREYAQYFDLSGVPQSQRGWVPFSRARRFRRLFERRGVDVSWAGGAKKLPASAAPPSGQSQQAPSHGAQETVVPLRPPRSQDTTAPVARYATFTPDNYDAVLEDIRASAMEAGSFSVALQATKLRAAYHGLLDAAARPAAKDDRNEQDDPFEGMSDAEAERAVEGLLDEYKKTTGRTLAPIDRSDDDGGDAA